MTAMYRSTVMMTKVKIIAAKRSTFKNPVATQLCSFSIQSVEITDTRTGGITTTHIRKLHAARWRINRLETDNKEGFLKNTKSITAFPRKAAIKINTRDII